MLDFFTTLCGNYGGGGGVYVCVCGAITFFSNPPNF